MKRMAYIVRQTAYTVFSFCFFLGMAVEMTLVGFVLLTLCGATDKNKLRYHRMLQRQARYVINRVPGTTFTTVNTSGETFEKPAMIVCNHQSHLDLMAVMMLTPKLIILTKDWVWRNPFYGIVIRYADFFPVSETEEMTQRINGMVQKGYSVVIFPEGTRSEDGRIQRFHRGAFYLAEQLSLDIVPVVIKGFSVVLPKKSFHLHPGKMSMEVMKRLLRSDSEQVPPYREMAKRLHKVYVEKINEK